MESSKLENAKKQKQTIQLVLFNLNKVLELHPKYRIVQHISYIMDKKNSYNWTNEKFLSELEKYAEKLETEYDDLEEDLYD